MFSECALGRECYLFRHFYEILKKVNMTAMHIHGPPAPLVRESDELRLSKSFLINEPSITGEPWEKKRQHL